MHDIHACLQEWGDPISVLSQIESYEILISVFMQEEKRLCMELEGTHHSRVFRW
jgi:hypothetical protein